MDLESLLTASLELEKRIATDQRLRKYFSTLWKEKAAKIATPGRAKPTEGQRSNLRQVTLSFSSEMCELLELASQATGKPPAEILEESFVEYYAKKILPRRGS